MKNRSRTRLPAIYFFLNQVTPLVILLMCLACSGSDDDAPDVLNENIIVKFIAPEPAAKLSYNHAHNLEVSVAGDVKAVEFYIDNQLIENVAAPPYKISWAAKDLDPGTHIITATAISGKGNKVKKDLEISLKLALGDPFRGGIVFELNESGDHGLISAKKDLLNATGQSADFVWGVDGLLGTTVDNGIENTRKLAAQATDARQMGYKFKDPGLEMDGFRDWYIPSLVELGDLRKNAALVGGFSKVPENATYWSSSERNVQDAFFINFMSVKEIYGLKRVAAKVRPIRKF